MVALAVALAASSPPSWPLRLLELMALVNGLAPAGRAPGPVLEGCWHGETAAAVAGDSEISF